MRHFFATTSFIINKSKWMRPAHRDEVFWQGATLVMLVVVTAIVAILAPSGSKVEGRIRVVPANLVD